uniref:Fungal lipase-like domain-containing protein n=1 Tax=Panagrolaimus sp. ES5 TaxID=591445 RepID=A0AC34FCV1_9BILA
MFPVAAGAYSNNPGDCLSTIEDDAQCELFNDSCVAYTAVIESTEHILISFRGTIQDEQLIQAAWDYTKLVPFLGGSVNKRFYDGFSKIWSGGMKDDINRLINTYPDFDIWITGHSVGGAMASIAAATIASTKIIPAYQMYLFTFGQPRTGNEDYAKNFNDLGMFAYRVVNNRDPIPHLPPLNENGYFHHGAEIWYDNDMSEDSDYRICELGENGLCSNSLGSYGPTEDNKNYFEYQVKNFGVSGCSTGFKNLKNSARQMLSSLSSKAVNAGSNPKKVGI